MPDANGLTQTGAQPWGSTQGGGAALGAGNTPNFGGILSYLGNSPTNIFAQPGMDLSTLQGLYGASSPGQMLSPEISQELNLGGQQIQDQFGGQLASTISAQQGKGEADSSVAAGQQAQLAQGASMTYDNLLQHLLGTQQQANQGFAGALETGAQANASLFENNQNNVMSALYSNVQNQQFNSQMGMLQDQFGRSQSDQLLSGLFDGAARVGSAYLGG